MAIGAVLQSVTESEQYRQTWDLVTNFTYFLKIAYTGTLVNM